MVFSIRRISDGVPSFQMYGKNGTGGFYSRKAFYYRLSRIQAILKMDLDDPDTRLLLRMAFKIMDSRNIQ